MCRNIKMLFNFDPPVTGEEIHAASLQFVRKVSGFNKPSKANEAAFLAAVVLAVAGLGFILAGDAARNAFARWIAPLGQIDRFTFARVDRLPARLLSSLETNAPARSREEEAARARERSAVRFATKN